uniref:Uncharacterized protein n=1 Tax=Triatoma infestans TaxID=30076 RepID=A0A161M9E6_TRIIF
MKLLTTKNRAT